MPPRITAKLKIGGGLTNTGPMTLNMDGIADIQVKREDGTSLTGGEFVDCYLVNLLFDGLNWIYLFSVLNSVQLTGNSTAQTPSDPLDNDNSIATTQWVQNLISGGAGIVLGQKVFKTVGTTVYTPHSLMESGSVECRGGEGGGVGANSSGTSAWVAGSGGGSGGYSRRMLTKTQIGVSQSVTIGAGGAAGQPAPNWVAGTGGDTFMGADLAHALCAARGGRGGEAAEINGVGGVMGGGAAVTT